MPTRGRTLTALTIVTACALAQAPGAAASSCTGAETDAAGQATAARHSNDMVQNGFFGHTSPAGSTFIDRIMATGYTRGARSWLVGENIVWGSGGLSTPASMVEAWMESPPHRANLLRGRFREIELSGARGTPDDAGDPEGITVSSEYGYRDTKKKRTRKRGRRAQARKRS